MFDLFLASMYIEYDGVAQEEKVEYMRTLGWLSDVHGDEENVVTASTPTFLHYFYPPTIQPLQY